MYIYCCISLKHNLCFWGIKNDNNDDNGFINSTSTWWTQINLSQTMVFEERAKRKYPETSFEPRVHQSGSQSPLFFWLAPRTRTSGSSTHAQNFETTAVVNGCENGPSLRLRINWKWPKSVFLVLAERKADSGHEIACSLYKMKFDTKWAQKFNKASGISITLLRRERD